VDEQFVAALRVIVDLGTAPVPAAAALVSIGELLLAGNDPPDGARLVLTGANVALAAGNVAAATAAGERALSACTGLGSALAGACRVLLGRLERRRRCPGPAGRLVHEGLGELVDAGLWFDVPDALELLGGLAVDAGRAAEGTRLLAAAEALDSRMGRRSLFAEQVSADLARASAVLDGDADRIRAEGAALDAAAAVAYARRAHGERKRPTFGWDSLTPTEHEVALLVAAGLTNPEIGERLFVSRGTVKTHLLHVFAKLGVHSRAELAATVTRRGPG
jgi:DNA-binding CsgD family transcriptional regulator